MELDDHNIEEPVDPAAFELHEIQAGSGYPRSSVITNRHHFVKWVGKLPPDDPELHDEFTNMNGARFIFMEDGLWHVLLLGNILPEYWGQVTEPTETQKVAAELDHLADLMHNSVAIAPHELRTLATRLRSL